MERIIEICCGSYEDALNAYHGGAKRIELNNALHLGGLTPSLATLKLTKKNTNLKVITMVRPRGAGFCYNEIEFEVMKEDAKSLLENGADGIAFGCLNKDRILTSGLKPKAIDGKDLIKNLQEKYGSQIEILAGSGMNASNAKEMMKYTGINQVHSSCKDWVNDATTHRHEVSYAYAPVPHENDYDVVSKELVEKIVKSIYDKKTK